MTKADIVDRVLAKTGFTRKECVDLVEQVFEALKDTLENSEKIKVAGFGNFEVKEKANRRGRNPQTGEEITIEARKILTFKASAILKDAINQGLPR
jgi:integration host factor subunit alpha